MNKRNLSIFLGLLFFLILINQLYNANIFEEKIITSHFAKTVEVNKNQLFLVISNVTEYPIIFPENVRSIEIINQTNSVIYAKETIKERGIETTLLIKHTIIPFDKHIIEVIEGEARGTKITINFEGDNNSTKISASLDLHIKGVLIPFYYLTKPNLESALNTVIDTFVNYAQKIAQ